MIRRRNAARSPGFPDTARRRVSGTVTTVAREPQHPFPLNLRSAISIAVFGAAPALLADPAPPNTSVTELAPVVVTGQLDESRDLIMPSLGATSFIMDQQQILNLPGGADATFNQVLLHAPGVAEDSAANGDLHVRGEHANLQYRINDVILPEGISGFGLELDPRFVGSMQLITGSLPAQYGFRTAGVVDIKTKNGFGDSTGELSVYGGSFDTIRPSFEAGGSSGNLSYYHRRQLRAQRPRDREPHVKRATRSTTVPTSTRRSPTSPTS